MQVPPQLQGGCRQLPLLQGHDESGDDTSSVSSNQVSLHDLQDEATTTEDIDDGAGPSTRRKCCRREPRYCPLSESCILANALLSDSVTRDILKVGCKLFQRLVHAEYADPVGASAYFFAEGNGPIVCGLRRVVNFDEYNFLLYVTCMALAIKGYMMRMYSNTPGRRVRMALQKLGLSHDEAFTVWERVVEYEYPVLEALDWRVVRWDDYQGA